MHPGDKGFFLDSDNVHKVNQLTPIDGRDPCKTLTIHRQTRACDTIKDVARCNQEPACSWYERSYLVSGSIMVSKTCASVFRDTLMAAHATRDHRYVLAPTNDDLAGLYFLYPHKIFGRVNLKHTRINLMNMTVAKLRYMAKQEKLPEVDINGNRLPKAKLAKLIGEKRSEFSLRWLERAMKATPNSKGNAKKLGLFKRLAAKARNLKRWLAGDKDADGDGVNDREQPDADKDGVSDSIEDGFRQASADANAGAVHNDTRYSDLDGDGISNEVEDGIGDLEDALVEMEMATSYDDRSEL